ncbi:MAG: hypothetical protein HYR74_03955 [Candidatus Eisenbacteria bacterium]|nr:hypothetical protein [Candidatus Eisenbacteria bacterium]
MDPLAAAPATDAATSAAGATAGATGGGGSAAATVSRFFAALLVLALIAAFAAFVWPTQWRYDHITIGNDTYPVRIQRMTGHADILLPGDGWTPAEDVTNDSSDGDEQPGNKT